MEDSGHKDDAAVNEGAPPAVFSAKEEADHWESWGARRSGLEQGPPRPMHFKEQKLSFAKCQQEPSWTDGPRAGLGTFPLQSLHQKEQVLWMPAGGTPGRGLSMCLAVLVYLLFILVVACVYGSKSPANVMPALFVSVRGSWKKGKRIHTLNDSVS